MLELSNVLEGVQRGDAVVVVASDDEDGGIDLAGHHIVQRAVRLQHLEVSLHVWVAIVRPPRVANGELMELVHVEDAHLRDDRGELLRREVSARGGEEAAVGAALDSEVLRRAEGLAVEVLGTANEISEAVHLRRLSAAVVPLLAILTAAADIGDAVNAAEIVHEDDAAGAEGGGDGDVEATVTIQHRRVGGGEVKVLAVDDEHRNLRAILNGNKHLRGGIVVRHKPLDKVIAELRESEGRGVEKVRAAGEDKRRHLQRDKRVETLARQLRDGANRQLHAGQRAVDGCLEVAHIHHVLNILEVNKDELVANEGHIVKHRRLLLDELRALLGADVEGNEPAVGGLEGGGEVEEGAVVTNEVVAALPIIDELVEGEALRVRREVGGELRHPHLVVRFAPLGDGDEEVLVIVGHDRLRELRGVLGDVGDADILRLVRAEGVVVDGAIDGRVRLSALLLPLGEVGVADVEKAVVAQPLNTAELNPLNLVGKVGAGRVADKDSVPVGPLIGEGIGKVLVGLAPCGGAEGGGAVGGKGVGVEPHLAVGGGVERLRGHVAGLVLDA